MAPAVKQIEPGVHEVAALRGVAIRRFLRGLVDEVHHLEPRGSLDRVAELEPAETGLGMRRGNAEGDQAPRAASTAALCASAAKAETLRIQWSAGITRSRACSPQMSEASRAATATAGAVLRPNGSAM